jgi:hypothetical protein
MRGEGKKSYCFASYLARINQGGDENVTDHYSATKVRFVLVTRRGKLDSPSYASWFEGVRREHWLLKYLSNRLNIVARYVWKAFLDCNICRQAANSTSVNDPTFTPILVPNTKSSVVELVLGVAREMQVF